MSYLAIEDFKIGLDRRKSQFAGIPGSLWEAENCHITRGGEVERCKKFVQKYSLYPNATFGLLAVKGKLHVFGSSPEPVGHPVTIAYQRLQHPDGMTPMISILDAQAFDGKAYTIAKFADGNIFHFYDGVLVTDWHGGEVFSYMADNDGIAQHLTDLINADTGWTAVRTGGAIAVTGTGDDTWTYVATATGEGTPSLADTVTSASGPKIITFTVGGDFTVGNLFTIKLTQGTRVKVFGAVGRPEPRAEKLLPFKTKMYAAKGSVANFSAANNVMVWNRDDIDVALAGMGFINAASQDEGSQDINGMGIYSGELAFFNENSIQTWNVAADPTENVYLQTLDNTGTTAGKSIIRYGNNDLFYLDRVTGIRSIRARDASNAPFVNDVGTAIDTIVQEHLDTLLDTQIAAACGAIEPRDGRYMLAVDDRIYVFSYFPASKVNAWSFYSPGFAVTAFARIKMAFYVRAGDNIYAYGDESGSVYPDAGETPARILTPFHSVKTPATQKKITGFDIGCANAWECNFLYDLKNPTLKHRIGTFSKPTYSDPSNKAGLSASHIAVEAVCSAAGRAVLASMAIHYHDPFGAE